MSETLIHPGAKRGIGDNQPPDEMEIFKQDLEDQTAVLRERTADLQVGLARVPETIDENTEGLATDFAAQVRKALKEADDLRVKLKKPHDDKGKLIQHTFKLFADPVDKMLKTVTERLNAYRVEKERKIREEAARKRQEAEAEEARKREEALRKEREAIAAAQAARNEAERKAAAAAFRASQEATKEADKAAKTVKAATKAETAPVHLKGGYGTTGYTRTHWTYEVEDEAKVPRMYCSPDSKKINEAIKNGARDIPGLNIKETSNFITRS